MSTKKYQNLKDLVLSKPFSFWCCSNPDHKKVTWNGDTATCDECGESSKPSEKEDK